jgi:HAD superfamily hydrolase (TIGR01509 family)
MTHWQPAAVIFVMDGLLVDSEPVWEVAENGVFARYGVQIEPHVRRQIIGLRSHEFLDHLRLTYNVQTSLAALQEEILGRMERLIPDRALPRPGAPELVAYVEQHSIPRAIASSSPLRIIDAVIESRGWKAVFPVRCSGDEVPLGKPAPDVYLEAARRINVAPADCLALEDSPNGARAAVAAGMVCYAVPDPSHTAVEAFAGITPHIFDSLHAVLAHLQNGKSP